MANSDIQHTDLKSKVNVILSSDKLILALEERVFCVGVKPDKSIFRVEGRKIRDILPNLQGASLVWMDYVVDGDFHKEVKEVAGFLGFSDLLIKSLLKSGKSNYEDFGQELGILIPAMRVEKFNVTINPVLILLKDNMIITIHTSEITRFFRLRKYAETLLKKFKKDIPIRDKITIMLCRLIDENNSKNFDYLRTIEEQGDQLSGKMADPNTSRRTIGKDIHEMKHALIVYLGGLWATVDVLNTLRYGDADLLTDDDRILNRIIALNVEVNSQINLSEHLSDVLASGLEVVQSIYNNQLQMLNNRLALVVAYLTIIGTAVLVPNTLATIFSNPVYSLTPADAWWYNLLMILSTVISTAVAYLWVKRQGWLAKEPK